MIEKPVRDFAQLTHPTVDDLPLMGSIWHEVHHWITQSCSTFGLFLNMLHNLKPILALTILHKIQVKTEIRKPVVVQVRLSEGNPFFEDLKGTLDCYLSVRKLIDVLSVSSTCTFNQCVSLFRKSSPAFFYLNGLKSLDAAQPITEEYSQIAKATYKRWVESKDDSFRDDNKDEDQTQTQFMTLLESIMHNTLRLEESDCPLNPGIRFFEKLDWPTLLEGSAKLFQASYVAGLAANHVGETDDLEKFDIAEKWQQWDSIYVRPFRTMLEILYDDEDREYEYYDIALFMAIIDLAINPSLDLKWVLPDKLNRSLRDFLPSHRFVRACRAAQHITPMDIVYENKMPSGDYDEFFKYLVNEYKRYVSEICARLGWEPPWIQAKRWLAYYPEWPQFFGIYPFLAGCKLRVDRPLFFGLPHMSFEKSGESWNSLLRFLPVPSYSISQFPDHRFTVSPDAYHRSALDQQNVLAKNLVLDQIFLNEGPIDWDFLVSLFGEGAPGRIEKRIMLYGIDTGKIKFS